MVTFQVKQAKGFWEQLIGLLGQKTPTPLLLQTRFGIHTFGLKFSLDVLILDAESRVKCYRERLSPQSWFFWNPRYKRVLELPGGTIKEKNIKINDQIKIRLIHN